MLPTYFWNITFFTSVIRTVSESAIAQEDFVHTDTKVDFNPGQSGREIQIVILNDDVPEHKESFKVQLYDGPKGSLVEPKDISLTIYDDDVQTAGKGHPFFVFPITLSI